MINYDKDVGVIAEFLAAPQNDINGFRKKTMDASPLDIKQWIYDMFVLNETRVP